MRSLGVPGKKCINEHHSTKTCIQCYQSGASCSKLKMSLVNISFNITNSLLYFVGTL